MLLPTTIRPRALTLGSALLLLAACASNPDAHATHGSLSTAHAAHWSYEGSSGPESWGQLDAAYSVAATGKSQSPIDIATRAAVEAQLPALELETTAVPLRILDNGHTVQVNCAAGNTLGFRDQRYDLAQFHFHSPSEHTIDGKHAAIEMHMVHKAPDGHAAVVGLMIQEGAANPNFARIWENLPRGESAERQVAGVSVDPGSLLPKDRGYYFYDGSLTTPPCSEGLRWFVLKQPVEMSAEQIATFRKLHSGNNRPVQPHHARVVFETP